MTRLRMPSSLAALLSARRLSAAGVAAALAASGLTVFGPWVASAQAQPLPQPTAVVAQAESLAAAGDTASAVALLDSVVRADKKNASAWHQLGLLNWNMAKSARNASFIRDQKAIRRLSAADSSLRLATQFAPDSAAFWLSLGRFNLTSGVATMRFSAGGQVSSALDAATKTGNKLLIAMASDEVGMAVWRRYEPVANRAMLSDGQQKIQLGMFNNFSRDKARDFIDSYIHKIQPPTGEKDYLEALEHFRTAVEADPTGLRYSRHLYMAYGERGRWEEMLDLARARARTSPFDYQAQLVSALAMHRMGDDRAAQVAFDSAFALMDESESARMTRFTRILRPRPTKETKGTVGDTLSFAKLPPEQQRGLEQMYWFMADPLSLTTENEYRLEFLARVVWADLRWTNEDLDLRGADTDRGDVFVRYGPPDLDMTVPGTSSFQASNTDGGVTLVWAYKNGLVFFFDLPPGYGTARYAFVDRDNVEQMKSAFLVSWDNIPSTRMIDTIPIRVARFRAGADSTDAVIATLIPVDSLVRGLDVTSAPVDVDFRIFDQFVRAKGVESERQGVRPDTTNNPLARQWVKRLGPGINVVRVEALQADSRRAARATTRVNPESTEGFGISDILLGTKPEPREGAPTARWRDVNITPNAGTFAHGASVGMVWELYDLVARDNSIKYRVSVTIERTDRSALGSFAARFVDGLGRTIGREQTSRDKISIGFDRTAAVAPALVEFLSVDLSNQSAGSYRLRIEVTDRATGKKVSQQTDFTIK